VIAEVAAELVDGGHVDGVGVGIDSADHGRNQGQGRCHDGCCLPLSIRLVDAGRASRQDIDEALARLLLGHVRPTGERDLAMLDGSEKSQTSRPTVGG